MSASKDDEEHRAELVPSRIEHVRTSAGSSVTVREGTASRPSVAVVMREPQARHDNIDRVVFYRTRGAVGLRVELTQALDRVILSCVRLQLMLAQENESRVAGRLADMREFADGVPETRGQPLALQLRRAQAQLADCESALEQIISEETGR